MQDYTAIKKSNCHYMQTIWMELTEVLSVKGVRTKEYMLHDSVYMKFKNRQT